MNIYTYIGINCLIVAPVLAIEIRNQTTLPIIIDSITLNADTGLNLQPHIIKKGLYLGPSTTVDHKELTGREGTQINQLKLIFNNKHYTFSLPPEQKDSYISIDQNGYVQHSPGIRFSSNSSTAAPTRESPSGPRFL